MEDAIFEFSTGEDLKAEKILMGIIEVDKSSPPYTYRWASDLPTVAAMLNYKKVV